MTIIRTTLSILFVVALTSTMGCAHKDLYTFANTRKLLESDAIGVTKFGFAPVVGVVDMVASPLTTYLDAGKYSAKQDRVYLSYLGTQTLAQADMHPAYKLFAGVMMIPMDTAWFPIGGTVDTVRVLNRTEPVVEEVPDDEPSWRKRDRHS